LQGNEQLTGVFDTSSDDWSDGSTPDISVPDNPYHTPPWLDLAGDSESKGIPFHKIYGIPESLAVLIYNSGQVIRALERERNVGVDVTFVPESLMFICNSLEEQILDWPVESEAERCSAVCDSPTSAAIMKHQIHAFHSALVIYFSQSIRCTAHQLLRPYVELVLENVMAAEAVKTTAQLIAGPCFWPTFIASSAALDISRQAGFIQLFEKMESYGFNTARSGHSIIREIWQKWQAERVYVPWRTMIKERGITLMLTYCFVYDFLGTLTTISVQHSSINLTRTKFPISIEIGRYRDAATMGDYSTGPKTQFHLGEADYDQCGDLQSLQIAISCA
jgi:hypothetical protein